MSNCQQSVLSHWEMMRKMNQWLPESPAVVGFPRHRGSGGAGVPPWVSGVAKAERLSLTRSEEPRGQELLQE